MNETLKYFRLSPYATAPKRRSTGAAGYDLASAEEAVVLPFNKQLLRTDLIIKVPTGCYGRIAPRSGLALFHSITVGAGVIDADYRGNVYVLLFNHGAFPLKVKRGDRIAQLILERIVTPEAEEVNDMDYTERGSGCFGSTDSAPVQ